MTSSDRPSGFWLWLSSGLGLVLLTVGPTTAQAPPPPTLLLDGVLPGGVRRTATENWGAFDIRVSNLTDQDRLARVLLFYAGQEDLQYGRDLWVPARATVSTWVLAGPCPPQGPTLSREIQTLLFDRTDGQDRLVLPPTE